MPPVVLFAVWYGLLALAIAGALYRGDRALRGAVAVVLATSLLGPWLIDHHGWRHLQGRLLAADVVQLAVFGWALMGSRRGWAGLATVLQAASVAVHLAAWRTPETLSAAAYATALMALSWLILAALLSASIAQVSRNRHETSRGPLDRGFLDLWGF